MPISLHRPLLAFLAVVWLLAAASPAQAMNGGYAVESWAGCGGAYNSGTWDDAGRMYIPCGNPSTVGISSPRGELVGSIGLGYYANDVAPTADGRYVYTAHGCEYGRIED